MPKRDYPVVSFANGQIQDRMANLMPRWRRRRGAMNVPGPEAEYVHAFAMKHSPNWLVFWPKEWAIIGDEQFICAYAPSNQESRDNLIAISKRRPLLMMMHSDFIA
jgi:hypothetical protein